MGWISEGDDWGVDGINFDYLKRKLSPEEEAKHLASIPPQEVLDWVEKKATRQLQAERAEADQRWPYADVPEFWNNLPDPILKGTTPKGRYWEVVPVLKGRFVIREWPHPPAEEPSEDLTTRLKALVMSWPLAKWSVYKHTDQWYNWPTERGAYAVVQQLVGYARNDPALELLAKNRRRLEPHRTEIYSELYGKPLLWSALLAEAQAEP